MRPLFGPGDIQPGATALDVALTQLGVRESAPNRGMAVDIYLASVGLDPSAGSYPWCAAFAFWCAQQAGLWVPRTARAYTMWERGASIRVATGDVGDVAIHLRKDGTGHVGIVMDRRDGAYQTVDGNTNVEGAREGNTVGIVTRAGAYWHGFLRPARLGDDLT